MIIMNYYYLLLYHTVCLGNNILLYFTDKTSYNFTSMQILLTKAFLESTLCSYKR